MLFILLAPLTALAAGPSLKDLNAVLASYRKANAVHAKVNKTIEQELMGTSMKSQGEFYFSKGKLRLEMREPEHTVLVYDGNVVWFESRADEEHIVVTKIKSKDLRRSDSLLAALFDRKDVLDRFVLKGSSREDSKETFKFDAKDKSKSDVKQLEIGLRGKDIQRISYRDQADNHVTLEFSDLSKSKVDAAKFAYKIPKHAEVQEM